MIHITTFAGMKPAVSNWLLPPHMATEAHNARLQDGTLQAFGAPTLVTTAAYAVLGMYLPSDGANGEVADLVTFPYPVSVTEGPGPGVGSHWDHLIVWPLNGDAPFRQNRYTASLRYPLIVPGPTKTLNCVITSTNGDSIDPEERSYTYTWVDQFNVESPPAPPSTPFVCRDGDYITITNFDAPPSNAVYMRLYRNSVHMEMGDKDAPFGSSFQLVEEISLPLASPTYIDTLRLYLLTYGTLQTLDNQAPLAMGGVVLTHEGYYVGFSDSEMFVSERHEPHNWPEKNRVELPDTIVGLVAYTHVAARYGHIMTHDLVYVMTTGRPYRVSVAWHQGPDNTSETNVQPVAFDEVYRCLDKHATCKTNDGATYISDKGVVTLQFQGPAVLSHKEFGEDYFGQYAPNLMTWMNGRLYATSNPSGRGFIMDDRKGEEGGKDLGDLVTIDLDAIVLHPGHDGRIYYARGQNVYSWNTADRPMTYRWRSKLFRSPELISLGAAVIKADFGTPITFRLFIDGQAVSVYERTVMSSRPFKLPSLHKSLLWQIELEGSSVVREVHVASTIRDLAAMNTAPQRDQKERANA